MSYETLLVEKNEGLAVVTFNRPKALNALSSAVLKELDCVASELEADKDVHVIIFNGGESKGFIAGADISEMSTLSGEEGRQFGILGQRVFRKIEVMDKPTIAAINGFALGGGCEFSMCCDLRIASVKAKFGQPEVGLGITPGFSGTQRLPKIVGVTKAKELIYTADLIGAEEAERIGLVNKVVEHDQLMDEARKMASKIMKNAQLAVRYSKAAINKGLELDVDTGNEVEASYFGLCFATEDQSEGMGAFLNKSKPNFKTK